MIDALPFDLPFKEACEYFASKGIAVSPDSWKDIWQQANARSFTAAQVTSMEALTDIKGALQKALDEGTSLADFKSALRPVLESKGWFAPEGEKARTIGPDGEPMKRLNGWRLDTIYQTNLQAAYSVGRFQQMKETAEARPYWQYMAIVDSRTRYEHAAQNGKVYDYRHPFWNEWYPPNGFNCRCYVKALSGEDLGERNLSAETRGVNVHPDEGWRYNVGQAGLDAWQPDLDGYAGVLASQYVADEISSPSFERFFDGSTAGSFPVAILDDALQAAIGSQSQVVSLSSQTLAKNRGRHPELAISDYRLLPDIVDTAQLIVQDGDNTFVFLRTGDKVYFGAIKTTQTGRANFLTSFRLARESDIESIKKRGKVLRDLL
ncbi:MAG: minor capsid protein [Desulfobacteraceae bacterium]|nr:minor capsid protein [Desulfobacteraceae bacterium]